MNASAAACIDAFELLLDDRGSVLRDVEVPNEDETDGEVGPVVDHDEGEQISAVPAVLEALPPGQFLLVSIETREGDRPKTDALILRPVAARDTFGPDAEAEYDGAPCIAFAWVETLEPMYAGHPGSIWPVEKIHRVGDRVILAGPRGNAIVQSVPPMQSARLGGLADSYGDYGTEHAPRLPLNRKERFYTGTVLPAIVAGDGFQALDRLLRVCGLGGVVVGEASDVQFYSEYSFAESVYTDEDKKRFRHRPASADTPDLVVCGPDWLLAIEARMFHRPNAAALTLQYERQSLLVEYWRARFGFDARRVRHVLLLPAALASAAEAGLSVPVVTWEDIATAYSDIADAYWLAILNGALQRYEELASKESGWGQNTQLKLTGTQIAAAVEAGNPAVAWVGRRRGLTGPEFADDIANNGWKSRLYEVRATPPDGTGANWFPATEFLAYVHATSRP